MSLKTFKVVGMMSGTSMDGIDISLVETNGMELTSKKNFYYEYSKASRKKMLDLNNLSKFKSINWLKNNYDSKISDLHIKALKKFKNYDEYDYIGFHGQTVIHNPQKKISLQIGDPRILASNFQKNIIFDFRANDLKNGGQGAPLAPIYHQHLIIKNGFKLPSCFVNIGGIANITYFDNDNLSGHDIGPGNVLMDELSNLYYDLKFDENGKIASSGKVIHEIVNSFFIFFRSFLIKPPPKSLDRNYFKNFFVNIIKKNYKKEDIMASFNEITAQTIAIALKETTKEAKSIIISGGGAYNKHLISRIKALISCKIIKTNQIDLNFIESELIAYLSARFLNNLPSTFEYTTGTNKPTVAGKEIIYNYKKPFLLSI